MAGGVGGAGGLGSFDNHNEGIEGIFHGTSWRVGILPPGGSTMAMNNALKDLNVNDKAAVKWSARNTNKPDPAGDLKKVDEKMQKAAPNVGKAMDGVGSKLERATASAPERTKSVDAGDQTNKDLMAKKGQVLTAGALNKNQGVPQAGAPKGPQAAQGPKPVQNAQGPKPVQPSQGPKPAQGPQSVPPAGQPKGPTQVAAAQQASGTHPPQGAHPAQGAQQAQRPQGAQQPPSAHQPQAADRGHAPDRGHAATPAQPTQFAQHTPPAQEPPKTPPVQVAHAAKQLSSVT